jgi:acetyltransferase
VLSSWLGGDSVEAARRAFADAQLPSYRTPEEAVRAFLRLVEYRRNQDLLMQVPPSADRALAPDTKKVGEIIARALAEERNQLSEVEAKWILAAYGIPVVETYAVASADEAVALADEIGYPVALKVVSPDIVHKAEVGGVMLNLEDAHQVRLAAGDIARRLRTLKPSARLAGFTVQRMIRTTFGTPRVRTNALELLVGVHIDDTFGPVILFGHGGSAAEAIADRAVCLPPLNIALARDVVSRTKISSLLGGYGDRAQADMEAIYLALVKVSQLIVDHPEIVGMDINPLVADDRGVAALDARMQIQAAKTPGAARLAIRPYPAEWEKSAEVAGRHVLIRPVRPDDARQHADFLARSSPDDLRLRFFQQIGAQPISDVARYTQIDYDRQMVFIAAAQTDTGDHETLGEARAVIDPDNLRAEVAIAVRSDFKRKGLGRLLGNHLVSYLRERGTGALYGFVRADNEPMLKLAQALGFTSERLGESDAVLVSLDLGSSRQLDLGVSKEPPTGLLF